MNQSRVGDTRCHGGIIEEFDASKDVRANAGKIQDKSISTKIGGE
jgi:hypothetical protein